MGEKAQVKAAPQKLPNNMIPVFKAPRTLLRNVRGIEAKIKRMQRSADRELKRLKQKWDAKMEPLHDELADTIASTLESHGLPNGLILESDTGIFLIPYRPEQGDKLMDVPALPELEDVSLDDIDAPDLRVVDVVDPEK